MTLQWSQSLRGFQEFCPLPSSRKNKKGLQEKKSQKLRKSTLENSFKVDSEGGDETPLQLLPRAIQKEVVAKQCQQLRKFDLDNLWKTQEEELEETPLQSPRSGRRKKYLQAKKFELWKRLNNGYRVDHAGDFEETPLHSPVPGINRKKSQAKKHRDLDNVCESGDDEYEGTPPLYVQLIGRKNKELQTVKGQQSNKLHFCSFCGAEESDIDQDELEESPMWCAPPPRLLKKALEVKRRQQAEKVPDKVCEVDKDENEVTQWRYQPLPEVNKTKSPVKKTQPLEGSEQVMVSMKCEIERLKAYIQDMREEIMGMKEDHSAEIQGLLENLHQHTQQIGIANKANSKLLLRAEALEKEVKLISAMQFISTPIV